MQVNKNVVMLLLTSYIDLIFFRIANAQGQKKVLVADATWPWLILMDEVMRCKDTPWPSGVLDAAKPFFFSSSNKSSSGSSSGAMMSSAPRQMMWKMAHTVMI